MGKVTINRPVLNAINFRLDQELGRKAALIEIKAKARVPVSNTKASGNKRGGGGHLQSSGNHRRLGFGRFRIEFNKEYAAYQERGMRRDGTHVVKNYSTPGTGKDYLKGAAAEVIGSRFGMVTK